MISKTSILIFMIGLTLAILGNGTLAQNVAEHSAVEQLLADLDSAKFDVRQNASDVLAQLELKAVPQLVGLVLNGSPEQTWRASKILMEIGTQGNEPTMVKIGRIFFLLGIRQPELITKAHLIRTSWKLRQLDRVVEKINNLGGQVTKIPASPVYNRAIVLREPVPPILGNGRNEVVDSPDSTTEDSIQLTESETESLNAEPLSNELLMDRTREVLGASADEDIRAFRAESELREDLIPTEELNALGNFSFQITMNEKWRGTNEDFQSLLDLPWIDFLQLTNLKLSKQMFQTLHRCQLRALSIEQCELDSADLVDFANRNRETYFNVRGRALLGVRGMVQVRTEADGLIGGCSLSDVVAGGPAELAGIRVTDIILKVGDAKITKFQDLLFIIAGKKPGDRIDITVARDDQEKMLNVTLGDSGDYAIR